MGRCVTGQNFQFFIYSWCVKYDYKNCIIKIKIIIEYDDFGRFLH